MNKKILATTITIILGVNGTPLKAEVYTPIKGGNITLKTGDRVEYDSTATTSIKGIALSSPTDKLIVEGSATIDIKNGGPVTGIYLANNNAGNPNDLGSGTEIKVSAGSGSSIGLYVINQSHVIADNININLLDSSGYGVQLQSASYVNLGDKGSIAVSSSSSGRPIGIDVGNNSTLIANGVLIDVDSTKTSSWGAAGVNVDHESKVDLGSKSFITIKGRGNGINISGAGAVTANQLTVEIDNGYGAQVHGGSMLDLGSGSTLKTNSTDRDAGILVMGSDTTTGVSSTLNATELSMETIGSHSTGLAAQDGGIINIFAGSKVITQQAHGISAFGNDIETTVNFLGSDDSRNMITVHAQSAVLAQGKYGTVNIKNTDIMVNNSNADPVNGLVIGLWAVNKGTINATNISINTVEKGVAVSAQSGGNAILAGIIDINAGSNDGSALTAQDEGSKIDLSGQANITGNVLAAGSGSSIDVDIDTNSLFKGTSKTEDGATFNLKMTDSTWNMTDSSNVTNLALDKSIVNFTNNSFTNLTADTLQGNGLFNLKTDIIGQQSDLIIINEKAEGSHQLNITNNGSAATDGTETLTVVQVNGQNNATFALTNKVELGAYEYDLQASGNDMILTGSPQSNGSGTLTSTAQAASSFLNIGYLTNYIENQTLLQRLGDLRNNAQGNTTQDGLWIKEYGGKLNSFAGHTLERFRMTYTGTQLGIDKQLDIQNGNLILGAMAGYTRTNPNYRQGNGTGKNYTAGLYATYYQDNGLYLDTVLKYNSMRNHFSVKDTAGNNIKGTGKTQGISLSTELGKRYWLTNQHQGLYIEPQAQLTYGYQNGDTVHANNGLKIGLSHYNSTLGRVSGILGYQTQGETPVNVYLKTGVVREMSGGTHYRYNNGTKNSHSFRSNWIDNGIGINVNIKKQHNLYAEADYATGNQFDNAKLDIGYRYSF